MRLRRELEARSDESARRAFRQFTPADDPYGALLLRIYGMHRVRRERSFCRQSELPRYNQCAVRLEYQRLECLIFRVESAVGRPRQPTADAFNEKVGRPMQPKLLVRFQ